MTSRSGRRFAYDQKFTRFEATCRKTSGSFRSVNTPPTHPAAARDRINFVTLSQRDSCVPSKVCPVCGRGFHWRRKWASDWASVRFCSDACRRRGDADPQVLVDLRARVMALPARSWVRVREVLAGDTDEQNQLAALRLLAAGGGLEFRSRGHALPAARVGLGCEFRRVKGVI
jgi:hypothetical protein